MKQESAYSFGSSGEFGEVLARAAYEATQGTVTWFHWEQGSTGPLAVCRYAAKVIYKFPKVDRLPRRTLICRQRC